MLLEEWFAAIRDHHRRSSPQRAEEEGEEITRRLQELLGVTKPKSLDSSFTKTSNETDPLRAHREKAGA
jgi:hypothetical protein